MSKTECARRFNSYCYVCGKFILMPSRKKLSSSTAQVYEQYFNLQVIQNVWWAPSIVCTTCYNTLHNWLSGKREAMPFCVPMIWTDPIEHTDDNCYACVNNTIGYNRTARRYFVYKELRYAQLPIPHSDNILIPNRPVPYSTTILPLSVSQSRATGLWDCQY